MQSETVAQEFARLVKEYHEGDDHTKPEAWNLLADYAVDNADAISAALSDKQAGEVKIKPLEWSSEPPYRVARPFTGLHYATEVVWPENGTGFDYVLLSGPTIGTKRFAALSDAQAAAQADYEQRIRSALVDVPAVEQRKFKLGDHVCKTKGSSWIGHVVGFYSTELTPVGYAVESSRERGSVQIYPEAALKLIGPASPLREGEDSAEVTAAIRSAGIKARDELLERMADGGSVDNDLADYMSRIIDACERAALAATRSASATSAKGCAE